MVSVASLGTPLRLVSRSPFSRLKETTGALCLDSRNGSLQTLFSETFSLTGYVQRALVFGENWLLMGKGDARTKKGKIFRKSNGNTRVPPRKLRKKKEKLTPTYAPPLPAPFLEPFDVPLGAAA